MALKSLDLIVIRPTYLEPIQEPKTALEAMFEYYIHYKNYYKNIIKNIERILINLSHSLSLVGHNLYDFCLALNPLSLRRSEISPIWRYFYLTL